MPRHLTLLLLVAGLLAGCSDPALETAQAAPEVHVAAPVPAPTPVPIAEPVVASQASAATSLKSGTGVLPTGPGWDAFLETLAPEQRHALNAFNSRHFGVLRFENAAERRKLEALGFPTPEDVLEAAKLTDSELRARADAGDVQAQMLLIDRLTSQAEALYAAGDRESQAYNSASSQAFVQMTLLSARYKQSPFGPYLQGRLHWKLQSGQSPEVMAASLMVAADMGDWRARSWLTQFQRQNPQMDAARALTLYSAMRRSWRVQ